MAIQLFLLASAWVILLANGIGLGDGGARMFWTIFSSCRMGFNDSIWLDVN